MRRIIKDIKNKETGSISTLVLFTVLMFIVILMGTYLAITTLQKSQLKSDLRIQEIYQAEVDKVEEIYLEQEAKLYPGWDQEKKVNKPEVLTGMTPIKFIAPTDEVMGITVTTNENDVEWYEYGTTDTTKKWANAQTKDESMWVWIPRFAYKIDSTNKKIDVVFLIDKTDKYYNEDGTIGIAQRQTAMEETIDTTADYTVHPAFTDESSINYANGGWDSELAGIWVSKFEAGYASGNNNATVKDSNEDYNNYDNKVVVKAVETGTDEDSSQTARNWLDGIYGSTLTAIKYPVFMPLTYTMNYINHSDSYDIARALTDVGNIYGFSNTNADSHLIKDSEWGAIAYLAQSKYGKNGVEITKNNASLNSGGKKRTATSGGAEVGTGVDSVYGVTGCTSNSTENEENITTIGAINGVTGDTPTSEGIYVWNQVTGQSASTTGTIYGVYDISGGVWERTSSYISNAHANLEKHGESIVLENTSTKYTTVYPYSDPESSTIDTASQNNFASNTKIYGDAIRETTSSNAGTSKTGWDTSAWNGDYSVYPATSAPFFLRGGTFYPSSNAGAFTFTRINGNGRFNGGIRVVLSAVESI